MQPVRRDVPPALMQASPSKGSEDESPETGSKIQTGAGLSPQFERIETQELSRELTGHGQQQTA